MKPTCARCLKASSMLIMSKFNSQDLCAQCKEIEEKHADYPRADEAEFQAVKNGVKNYPGIGLPKDLRAKFIEISMDGDEGFFYDVLWNRFDGGYIIESLDDCGSDKCSLCEEPLKGCAVRFSTVDDVKDVCVLCSDLILAAFQNAIIEFGQGISNDRDELAKTEAKYYP
jgi:hypothetical protein